jgi:hypothetical protein
MIRKTKLKVKETIKMIKKIKIIFVYLKKKLIKLLVKIS